MKSGSHLRISLRKGSSVNAAGEKDQRIVSLTAQLTSARMREVVEERR